MFAISCSEKETEQDKKLRQFDDVTAIMKTDSTEKFVEVFYESTKTPQGPDDKFFTNDDSVEFYSVKSSDTPYFWKNYDSPGKDGIWFTLDDKLSSFCQDYSPEVDLKVMQCSLGGLLGGDVFDRQYYWFLVIKNYQKANLEIEEVYVSEEGAEYNGEDGFSLLEPRVKLVEKTESITDIDISSGTISRTFRSNESGVLELDTYFKFVESDGVKYKAYYSRGEDGIAETEDDRLGFFSYRDGVRGSNDYKYIYGSYLSSWRVDNESTHENGKDIVGEISEGYFSPFDYKNYVSRYRITKIDESEKDIKYIDYLKGPDRKWYTADDVVVGYKKEAMLDVYYHKKYGGEYTVITSTKFDGAGNDKEWFTVDDVVSEERAEITQNMDCNVAKELHHLIC